MLIPITPIGKPRMVRSDRWKKRACVTRYWNYKDNLTSLCHADDIKQPCHLIFTLPMPKSWSKKKKLEMSGKPHQSTPDLDNLIKAFFDCLLEQDNFIYDVRATKYWGEEGSIEILSL